MFSPAGAELDHIRQIECNFFFATTTAACEGRRSFQ